MPQPPPRSDHTPKRLSRRLDRVFGEINPILLAVAIGLAVLDATCFSVIRLSDEFFATDQCGIGECLAIERGPRRRLVELWLNRVRRVVGAHLDTLIFIGVANGT